MIASSSAVVRPVAKVPSFDTDAGARTLSAEVALAWVINLRWHAIGGQAIAIALAYFALHLELPIVTLSSIVVVTALSNVGLSLLGEASASFALLAVVMIGDALALTALLGLSGGPTNPFAMLYLAQVALAAFVLDPRWTIRFTLLVVFAYGALFIHAGVKDARLWGMWFSLAITAAVIAAVVRRLAQAVRDRQDALVRAQRATLRGETIASLGTLAAGAAHELNTPLGTIAVASNELDALIHTNPALAVEDACLIRDEVERCRAIIQRMAARAGEQIGELPARATLSEIRRRTLEGIATADHGRVAWLVSDDAELSLPLLGTAQALGSLIANALAATRADRTEVLVEAGLDRESETLRFVVVDRGAGIPRALRERLGDPFLTTNTPGVGGGPEAGMGLGIFLCQAFADAWHGELVFVHREDSEGDRGTTAILRLPVRCTQ